MAPLPCNVQTVLTLVVYKETFKTPEKDLQTKKTIFKHFA